MAILPFLPRPHRPHRSPRPGGPSHRDRPLRPLARRSALAPVVVSALTAATALAGAVVVGAATPAAAADWLDAATTTAQTMPTFASTYANRGIRVAAGVNPPTGSWLAPAVFVGDGTPRAVFTGPLAVKPSAQGFGVVAPTVTGSSTTVFGGYADAAALALTPPGTDAYALTRKDSLTADLTYTAAGSTVGVLTLAEGWAYAQYAAATDQDVRLTLPSGVTAPTAVAGGYRIGSSLLLVTPGTLSGATLHLARGQAAWVAAVAPGASSGDLSVLVAGATTLRGSTTAYAVTGGRAVTTYSLATAAPTVFAAMPAQSDISGTRLSTAYPSINGPMPAVTGTTFTTSTPAYDVPLDLDLSTLTAADRSTLTGIVSTDAGRVATLDATDSYYGGKQLTRAVQVYRLARQLGLTTAASTLRSAIVARLDQWFDPTGCASRTTACFAYDRALKGVVGEQPSYGSDTELNDHHFHYGYLLYAAGAMALDDASLTSRWSTMADTVAADIAATRSTATTVTRRHFDDYAGHGWASGVAPFADGNNEESSSEATNAWVGVTLWGRASGNADLATEGQWMFSREAGSAVAYWLKPAPVPGFTSPMAALLWGGKKDYATWFSAEPSAKVGIQVLPAAPAQLAYLRSVGAAQLTTLANTALANGISGKPLVDWSLALTSLADPARAQAGYAQLADGDIDNGDTRSYLYAVLHTTGTLPAPTGPPMPTSTTSTTSTAPTTSTSTSASTTVTSTTATSSTTGPTSTTSTTSSSATTSPTLTATSTTSTTASGSALDAFSVVPASAATSLTALTLSGAHTSPGANGAAAGFRLDFGTSAVADVVFTVSSGAASGVSGLLQVRLDSPTNPVVAEAAVASTGGWDVTKAVPANSASPTGVHQVFVTFTSGQPAAYAELWSVQFRRR